MFKCPFTWQKTEMMVYRILVKLRRVYVEEPDMPMKNRLEGDLDPDLTFSSTYYPLPKPLFHIYKVTARGDNLIIHHPILKMMKTTRT